MQIISCTYTWPISVETETADVITVELWGTGHVPVPYLLNVVNMNTSTHTKRWFLLWKAKGPMRILLRDPCASKYSIIVLSVFQHSVAW